MGERFGERVPAALHRDLNGDGHRTGR
jgi:hypothetical protein